MEIKNVITVYAGSADGLPESHMQAARILGATIAKQNRQMVYGAGSTGLMGAVADGALEAGGEVFGIINEGLNLDHLIHDKLTAIEVVEDIHTRQERMLELADAIIALPGAMAPTPKPSKPSPGHRSVYTSNPSDCSTSKAILTPSSKCSTIASNWAISTLNIVGFLSSQKTPKNSCAY